MGDGNQICETCGATGAPVKVIKGNILVELVLWLLGCLPGLIYTIWRLTTKAVVCGGCGGHMIPLGSPRGRELAEKYAR